MMPDEDVTDHRVSVAWWLPVGAAALAGGMAWGIRGQYGHESGAMIAGLLVSSVLVILLGRNLPPLQVVRAIAWTTVATGLGGSMTYGQTIGLTQNPPVLGNWTALGWGMLGLSIKGGLWIGFAGLFLGMGLGGVRYRPLSLLLLMLGMIGAYYAGIFLLNAPHDPENGRLPFLYFSAHWRWDPGPDLEPRPECWGGLLFALMLATVYTGWRKKDRLARTMAVWGVLGGALGFPLGQSLQAFHAWNPGFFADGPIAQLDQYMNWWNMMETTFGATMGAVLGLGLWVHRRRIETVDSVDAGTLPPGIEWLLLAVHVSLLAVSELIGNPVIETLYDPGVLMAFIPVVAIAGGRWYPYMQILPITLLPIAGKTVMELVYKEVTIPPPLGWVIYFIVPLLAATALAFWAGAGRADRRRMDRDFRIVFLVNVWMYFLLNFAYFRFPWPWAEWTARTPNGIIFTVCAVSLTLLAFAKRFPRHIESQPYNLQN
jgi:hypothetical protein